MILQQEILEYLRRLDSPIDGKYPTRAMFCPLGATRMHPRDVSELIRLAVTKVAVFWLHYTFDQDFMVKDAVTSLMRLNMSKDARQIILVKKNKVVTAADEFVNNFEYLMVFHPQRPKGLRLDQTSDVWELDKLPAKKRGLHMFPLAASFYEQLFMLSCNRGDTFTCLYNRAGEFVNAAESWNVNWTIVEPKDEHLVRLRKQYSVQELI